MIVIPDLIRDPPFSARRPVLSLSKRRPAGRRQVNPTDVTGFTPVTLISISAKHLPKSQAIAEGLLVPTNVLFRVFQVKWDRWTGTAFAIDVDDRQYLVSANHIFEGYTDGDRIQLRHADSWKFLDVQLVGRSDDKDIIVFAPSIELVHAGFEAEPTAADILLGQDAYFLGFPFGWRGPATELTRDCPLPFVKRASLAMWDAANDIMYFDGINNEGFSGGPVFFQVHSQAKWRFAGVVTAYHDVHQFIQLDDQDTALSYYQNSGLIYVTPIKFVVTLIRRNPVGLPVRVSAAPGDPGE